MGKKKISFVLAACLILCFCTIPTTVSAANMSTITSDSIKEKEEQVSQAKKEKENLQNSLTDLKKLKKDLEAKKANLASYIKELDANLIQIDQNIADLKYRISGKEEEIRLAEKQLEEALAWEEYQRETVTACIRFIYEAGSPSMWDMMLKAKSFSDFLNKADFVEKVISYGQQVLREYETAREYVELCKEKLEIERDILSETKESVQQEQKNLEELIEQKTQDLINYSTDINNKEKAIKEYEEEIKAQEEEIKLLEEAIAEEKRKILASSGSVLRYDGGVFKFPLATYTRISSEFGMRPDPILGVQNFHSGVDFAAPKGTAIYAAYDGKVVAATYSSSMGNYVMIDHGDGLCTIYMHASALYVKKDDIVVRGETIAAVGTTGRSTGNHLHFTVRLNGEYVSPWNYLSQ